MNFNELENYLTTLPDQVLSDAAEIVAETATTYYKASFTREANSWANRTNWQKTYTNGYKNISTTNTRTAGIPARRSS